MFSFLLLLLLLLLAASASAAPRGGAISLLAYAGTRIFFSYRFLLCFRTKQCDSRRATLYKKTLRSPFRIVFFGVFLSVWHFASVFTVFLLTLDFLHLPASTCISISALCGGGGGWGGGADDVHANAAYMYCFSFCSVHWWGGGGIEGDVGDVDVVLHDVMRKITKAMTIPTVIAMTMPIHCWLLLSRHQYKTLVFLRLSKQKLRNGPQNKKKKERRRTARYLRHFRKNLTNEQEQTTMEKNSETSSC